MASAAARPGYDSEGEDHLEAEGFGRSHAASTSWDAPEIVREARGTAVSCVDVARSRFPYAIVWTPLPLITWFLPFIGHMGICDSRGVVYDFAGPYSIGIDQMAFSKPTRYLVLNPANVGVKDAKRSTQQLWDEGVDTGCEVYSRRMHNICCDNCHSHVARCLNVMRYNGRTDWNMIKLAAWLFFAGRYVSVGRAVQTWLPFLLIVTFVVLMKVLL